MSYTPSVSTQDIVIPLQYVEEGTTASTFGVTGSSPAYIAAGINTEISLDPTINKENILALGNLDLVDMVKTGERYAFSLKSKIFNTTLAKYGFNTPGGSGTIDASLSFKYSFNIDGTEYFQKMVGCRPISTTLAADRGLWELSMQFICQDITDPNTTDPDTTPTNVESIPSSAALSHIDAAANPFTWDSVTYDTSSFSSTVSFDLAQLEVMGQQQIQNSRAVARKISASVEVYLKDNLLWADNNALNKISTAVMDVENGTSAMTFTDSRITDYDSIKSSSGTDAIKERLSIESESVVLS